MKAKIIRIGNSKGIRLPKLVLEQVGFADEVELGVRDGEIVISPAEKPRHDWAAAAQVLSARGDDQLLDEPVPTHFDLEHWEW